MMYGSRLRKIGWAVVLLTCTSLYAALHLRVNAVKSEVRLAERRIVQLQDEKMLLEAEFQTRANQRQLANWNAVEFGYRAPSARQFLEGERQLAQFGTPPALGAPAPILVAGQPAEERRGSSFAALVNPLGGEAMAAEVPQHGSILPAQAEALTQRLARGAAQVAAESVEGVE